MTVAELCLLAALILAIATVLPAKALGRREFDNANPRDPAFYASGFRARSLAAHQNGLEVFPFFAAAVLLAEMHQARQSTLDWLAMGFLLARLAYVGCYLGNQPTARSLVWTAGFLLNLGLFFAPVLVGR